MTGDTEGSLGGPNAGDTDAWLAHYDGAGNQLWIRQLGTSDEESTRTAASDGSGGVYVGGFTGGSLAGPNAGSIDALVARYDVAGNQVWIRQLGTSSSDHARAAAPDGSGGVYVSGNTRGSLGGPFLGGNDPWIALYDSTGNQVWIQQLGTTGNDGTEAAAPDGLGGVYVSGFTTGSLGGPIAGAIDAWVARYDGAGNQLWIRQLGTSAWDGATAAAQDGSGGVYVSGFTDGSLGGPNAGGRDVWLARYDSAGTQTWIRQLGTSASDGASGAAPDGWGGVYVTGDTEGGLGGPAAGHWDAWLAHYDGSGNQSWIRQLGTSDWDGLGAAAPDGTSGVFVGGATAGSLGSPNGGGFDALMAHYDNGVVVTRYCTPAISNSTGQPGSIGVMGTTSVANNNVTLAVTGLPPNSFGFFLTSRSQGLVIGPGGSQGNLCLGGAIGRYVGPGQIKNSGATGAFDLLLDLASTPTPTGLVQVLPGDTWKFTAWHRDAIFGAATSNFTDAVSVRFL